MLRILLADDHAVIRTGLKLLMTDFLPNAEVQEAQSGDKIISLVSQHVFDLLIMDIRMPDTDAIEILRFLKVHNPALRILIFSTSPDIIYGNRFLLEGAKGFVSKDAPLTELKKAIHLILNNRIYMSEKLMEKLTYNSIMNKPPNPFDQLSPREFEIASRILKGEVVSNISRSLNLRASTIGTHKARAFEKLRVHNILDLKKLADLYSFN